MLYNPNRYRRTHPPSTRSPMASVKLSVSATGLRPYARENLIHTRKASAIINALEPKSKPVVESAPTGETSWLATLPSRSDGGLRTLVQAPGSSPGSQTQVAHPHLHQAAPPIT